MNYGFSEEAVLEHLVCMLAGKYFVSFRISILEINSTDAVGGMVLNNIYVFKYDVISWLCKAIIFYVA